MQTIQMQRQRQNGQGDKKNLTDYNVFFYAVKKN